MPTKPLFVDTLDELKTVLGLDASTQEGTEALINKAVIKVRLDIYERVGSTRIAEIKDTDFTEEPNTDAELLRARARDLELDWVKLILVQELPILFFDGPTNQDQRFNEENLLTEVSGTQHRELIKRLELSVQEGLEILQTGESEGSLQGFVVEPERTPPRPGESVFPRISRGW